MPTPVTPSFDSRHQQQSSYAPQQQQMVRAHDSLFDLTISLTDDAVNSFLQTDFWGQPQVSQMVRR
jgi:hypothetical protein